MAALNLFSYEPRNFCFRSKIAKARGGYIAIFKTNTEPCADTVSTSRTSDVTEELLEFA